MQKLVFLYLMCSFLPAAVNDMIITASWEAQNNTTVFLDKVLKHDGDLPVTLLEESLSLLDKYHSEIIQRDTYAAPFYKIITNKFQGRINKEWLLTIDKIVSTKLEETKKDSLKEIIARKFPFTPSARLFWSYLADRAWDRGEIGVFLNYMKQSEKKDRRIELLEKLDKESYDISDGTLDFNVLWEKEFSGSVSNLKAMLTGINTVAITTSFSSILVDIISGVDIGKAHKLSNTESDSLMPVTDNSGIIIYATNSMPPSLLATDLTSKEIWARNMEFDGFSNEGVISNPIIVGEKVVLSSLTKKNNRYEIRVTAYSKRNGNPIWSIPIATVQKRHIYTESFYPVLKKWRGQILLLSNNGFFALIEPTGEIIKIIKYKQKQISYRQKTRTPRLYTEKNAILAASDNDVVFIVDEDLNVREYRGESADFELINADDNLLLGNSSVSSVSISSFATNWKKPLRRGAKANSWCVLFDNKVLLYRRDKIVLLDAKSGEKITENYKPNLQPLLYSNGVLLALQNKNKIIAMGDREKFINKILLETKNNPENEKAWIALSNYYIAKGKTKEATEILLASLQYGLRLKLDALLKIVRSKISLTITNDEHNYYINVFEKLLKYNKEIKDEFVFWKAKRLELQNEKDLAKKEYRKLLDSKAFLEIERFGKISLSWLANVIDTNFDLEAGITGKKTFADLEEWSISHMSTGEPFFTDEEVIVHADGFLRSYDLVNGKEIWIQEKNKQIRTMLGVNMKESEGGIVVTPLKGGNAFSSGMKTGDVLVKINGEDILTTSQVIEFIKKLSMNDPFETVLLRREKEIICKGRLGSWPEEVCAVEGDFVVTLGSQISYGSKGGVVSNPLLKAPNRIIMKKRITQLPTISVYKKGSLVWREEFKKSIMKPVLFHKTLFLLDYKKIIAINLEDKEKTEKWRKEITYNSVSIVDNQLLVVDSEKNKNHLISLDGLVSHAFVQNENGRIFSGKYIYSAGENIFCFDLRKASFLWEIKFGNAKIKAVSEEILFLERPDQELVAIDVHNGSVVKSYGKRTNFIDIQEQGESLFCYASKNERDVIMAISTNNAVVRWEQELPNEVLLFEKIKKNENSVYFRIGDENGKSIVMLYDKQGCLFFDIEEDKEYEIVNNSLLLVSEKGISSMKPTKPEKNKKIKCQEFVSDVSKIKWTKKDSHEFAILKSKNDLIIKTKQKNIAEKQHINIAVSNDTSKIQGNIYRWLVTKDAKIIEKQNNPHWIKISEKIWQDKDFIYSEVRLSPTNLEQTTTISVITCSSKTPWWINDYWYQIEGM